jgi:hypothetical protein
VAIEGVVAGRGLSRFALCGEAPLAIAGVFKVAIEGVVGGRLIENLIACAASVLHIGHNEINDRLRARRVRAGRV